jgi:hypothetical protein
MALETVGTQTPRFGIVLSRNHALFAGVRIANLGSAAMSVRSARAAAGLPMTNRIHGQTKPIGESLLAEAQALTDASYVHGLWQCDPVPLALPLISRDQPVVPAQRHYF